MTGSKPFAKLVVVRFFGICVFLLCQGNESANLLVERKCVVILNKIPWHWAHFYEHILHG